MHPVDDEKASRRRSVQLQLLPQLSEGDLQLVRSEDQVVVLACGFCMFVYRKDDRFSRNYCIVQLHLAGGIKLSCLASLFDLNYHHCSRILSRFKEIGVEGLRERVEKRYGNRKLIDEDVADLIRRERERGASYEEISEKIRFLFRKKIKPDSVKVWMCRQDKRSEALVQLEMDVGQEFYESDQWQGRWHRNIYAGSMILYALIQRTGFMRPFEEYIEENFAKRRSAASVRRVVLTLFFLHALRCKSIEQSKHIVGQDFCQILGGSFLRLQSLRYAIDEIVENPGFDQAIEVYYRDLIVHTEKGDRIYYTDGHFSTYYGKRKVPKGWDPRRQMPFKGRNTIYLHNSFGEVVYLFESATNTTLGNDIEKLLGDMEKLEMELKRKTLIFDRGGYSQKCFAFLKRKKMYFITYLKNRKKERRISEAEFKPYEIKLENGEKLVYRLYEGERRWNRSGRVRVIVLLKEDGNQVPILTSHPYMKVETIVYFLTRRWREENCFKFMIEHFGIDLLTTYKAERAPDKIIKRPNPERQAINKEITRKKNELAKLKAELASRMALSQKQMVQEFLDDEKELSYAIKNIQVDIDLLMMKRGKVAPQVEVNLSDEHVIMVQKRRLFINAIKAMNYNVEKWLQIKFKKRYHSKVDEILSLIRSLWKQPGRIREDGRLVEVELEPPDGASIRESVRDFLKDLSQVSNLRMSDGRLLRIKMMRRV